MRRAAGVDRAAGARLAAGLALVLLADGCRGPLADPPVADPPAAPASDLPGQPTGFSATGHGGRTASISRVEGAVPDGPRRLQDKPHPPRDRFVQRRAALPTNLHPLLSDDAEGAAIRLLMHETLLQVDPDDPQTLRPSLATAWQLAEDGRTLTFHLRQGVQHADGRPLDSADVRFSFEALRDPLVNAEHLRRGLADVEGLETPDAQTVVLHLKSPSWRVLYEFGLALPILNRAWTEERLGALAAEAGLGAPGLRPGEPGFAAALHMLRHAGPGTGPYYLAEEGAFSATRLELVQNPFYWGTQVAPAQWNFRALRWLTIPDPDEALRAFRQQAIDILVVEPQDWEDELRRDPELDRLARFVEYEHLGIGWSQIVWNTRAPPFDDPRVRRAMAHLLDRARILSDVERGFGQLARCPVRAGVLGEGREPPPPGFDPAEAARLLTEAGFVDRDGDGLRERDGRPLEVELKVSAGRRASGQIAAIFDEALRGVGGRVLLRSRERGELSRELDTREFQAVLLHQVLDRTGEDPYRWFHSSQDRPGAENLSGWRSERADRLLEAYRAEADGQARLELLQRFCEVFQEEQPAALLIHGRVGVLLHRRFQNGEPRAVGLRLRDLWVRPEEVLRVEPGDG